MTHLNYRQGDVPLIPFTGDLAGFVPVAPDAAGKVVLALGEATGHHHRFENCFSFSDLSADVRLLRHADSGAQVIEVGLGGGGGASVPLIHEEHDPVHVAPGRYLQLVQVEDDAEMIAAVAD